MGDRRIAWFVVGFATALLVAVLDTPARAQDTLRNTGESNPSGASALSRSRPSAQDIDDSDAVERSETQVHHVYPDIPRDQPATSQS